MTAPDWPCEAYGVAGLEHGARCFIAAADGSLPAFSPGAARLCRTPIECHEVMQAERLLLWRRLQAMTHSDDPENREIARAVLEGFEGPDDLLGGRGE